MDWKPWKVVPILRFWVNKFHLFFFQSLLDGLETIDSKLWRDVMVIQKQWIGECSGCRIEFKVKVIKGQGQFDKRLRQDINSLFQKLLL